MTIVKGFGNTIGIFRSILVDRRREKRKFNLAALAEDILGVGVAAARNNAEILCNLINAIGVDEATFRNEGKTVTTILNKINLQFLKSHVSAIMIDKIVNADISVEILREAYLNGGATAIRILLAEDIGGHPRVTNNAGIIHKVSEQIRLLTNENRQ